MTTIEKLKKGDYFRLKNGKSILVFDGWNPSTKKYSYYKFYDVNHFGEKKRGTEVEIQDNF